MVSKRVIEWLLIAVLCLPIFIAVLFLVQQLLLALADESGAKALTRLGVGLLILWGGSLISLLVAVTLRGLQKEKD